MKNILVVSVDALPVIGGVSLMTHHVCNAMSTHANVYLMCPSGSYIPNDYDNKYKIIEDFDSSIKQRAGKNGVLEDERIENMALKLLSLYNINSILLMHPFYYGIGLLKAAKKNDIEVSVYFHGFEIRSQIIAYNKKISPRIELGELLHEKTIYLAQNAKHIFVNSNYTKKQVEKCAVDVPIVVTGCGIEIDKFYKEIELSPQYDRKDRIKRKINLGLSSKRTYLYIGRFVETKGIYNLVKFALYDKNCQVILIGDGPEYAEIAKWIEVNNLTEIIFLVGNVSEEKKWNYLRAADFLCLLSFANEAKGQVEGFGIALLEGAMAGCVPISTGIGGMSDVVMDSKTGLLFNVEEFDICINKFIDAYDDGELMKRIVNYARENIKSKYNWNCVGETILAEIN